VCWCAAKACDPGRILLLASPFCCAIESVNTLKFEKHTERMRDVGWLPFLRFNFYYFNFFIIILKAKWPYFIRGANYFSGGRTNFQGGFAPSPWLRPWVFSGCLIVYPMHRSAQCTRCPYNLTWLIVFEDSNEGLKPQKVKKHCTILVMTSGKGEGPSALYDSQKIGHFAQISGVNQKNRVSWIRVFTLRSRILKRGALVLSKSAIWYMWSHLQKFALDKSMAKLKLQFNR